MSENHSNLNKNKRVQTLFRLSPSSIANVKCRKLNSGRYITVFSTGNKLLHIMENHKINCIINVGSCILRILDYVDEKDELWVITEDGNLWTIPISLHQENEQTGAFQINQQTNHETTQPRQNHDIFAELLSDDNKDISHSVDHRTQNASPFSKVYKCSDNSTTYWEDGLQNVAIGTHHIITCSNNNGDVRLTVYPWIKQNNDGQREIASHFISQTILPRHVSNHSNNDATVLLYVSPCDHPNSSKCGNSTLDQQLFGSLFPNQSEGNIPVVLVGLQSGFVGYKLVGVKNLNPNLQTLYHLEQKVVSIFAVCLKPPLPKGSNLDTTPPCNALGLLGALGKLVLLTQDNSNGLAGGILIREYNVPGPVVSATMNNNCDTLFYSTLKEIYVVKLQAEEKTEDKVVSLSPLPSSLSPITLYIPRVLALSIDLADEQNSMVCLKNDGCVLRVVPKPLSEEFSQTSTTVVSTASGEQIKKYLGEIQEKENHVKQLRDEIHQLDEVIKQLNLVTQVLCEILRNRKSQNDPSSQNYQDSNQSGISFNVDVDYEAQGASLNPRVILRCDLANSTKFPFSSNWSLVIQVRTVEPWFNESCSNQTTMSYSVPLSAAPVHHISIPMEDGISYLTPIQVSCYVCFGVKDLLPVFLKESEPALAEEGFTVLVSKTELNILNFLRKQELCSSVAHDRKRPTHLLENTLKSVNTTWVSKETPELIQEKSSEFCTFSVRLSDEAVNFIQKRISDLQLSGKKSEAIPKQTTECNPRASEDNLRTQEANVLQFILNGSRTHLYNDDMKYVGGHVVGRTPSEEVVKFQVMKLGQVGSTGGMEGLEVRVHTSSRALGCAVHSAVMKILKPVLQRNTKQISSVPTGELQKQLIKLKELQTSLDLLRPSFQSEEPSSTEEDRTQEAIREKLISIYSDLRKIHTIVP